MLLESLPYLGGGKLLVEGSILKVQTLRNSPFFRFAQVSWSLRQHRLDPGRARKWIRTKFIIKLKCVFLEKDVFSSFHENGSEEKSESQGGTELQILGFCVLILLPQS